MSQAAFSRMDQAFATAERFYGKYRGVVSDNADPEKLGRVRARVPEVLDSEQTGWALPCSPYAGAGEGSFATPPVGAGVWIEFEAGDVSRPVWTGCWWGRGQVPTNNAGGGAGDINLKVIRSNKGLMVTMDDGSQEITVSDSNGSNVLTIEVSAGKITVKGAQKAVVEAPQIELVENASHPVVFGDSLLQYLTQVCTMYQAHVHAGELALGVFPVTPAPPTTPLPTPDPGMLSTRVKTG
ncbi:MAG: phage baseplate assembly protein V [Phycisphaerales bacterium]